MSLNSDMLIVRIFREHCRSPQHQHMLLILRTRISFSLFLARFNQRMTDLVIHYSLADVAKCNGKNGTRTWIVIYDNVYDVTDYMQEV